jgi:hypothetical protein
MVVESAAPLLTGLNELVAFAVTGETVNRR